MKKRDWIWIFSVLIITWLLDQLTKAWALSAITGLKFFGPFGVVIHRNPGVILGTFANLPPLLRVVSLSTGGAFLIFIYLSIQYLLPSRSIPLRVGMSLLLGGILGNVTDRILSGAVTDFLLLGSREMATPAFNFADAIQWVGYGLVVYGLIREGNIFWPDSNVRKTKWVNPSFQLKYCMILVGIGLCFALVSGVFAYTFLKVAIDDLVIGPKHLVEARFLIPYLQTYLTIALGFVLILFTIGRILSHRTAGPVYAFENYLRDLMNGNDRAFRMRGADEFKELKALADELRPIILEGRERIGSKPKPLSQIK